MPRSIALQTPKPEERTRTVSAFTPNVQYPFVSGKPKDRKRGTAKKALISRTMTNLRVCGTILQEGNVHKELLPMLNEQGYALE
jgi:hypothetical protein